MDYKIDYTDSSNRQDIISVYSLYFYIVQSSDYQFNLGHLIISLLVYMVEEGRLNSYAMKVFDLKSFVNEYLKGIDNNETISLDELVESLLSKLQGAKASGEPILFKYYDSETKKNRSSKISYIDYDIKGEGFRVTDKGLEFLISSKEIPQEAKLTVALYLFKLQIEKGKYKAALNTIKNISLETLRQLDIKNEVLAMNRFGHEDASKIYKKYWGDFFEIRSEETSHYNDARDKLNLYKDTVFLEKNNIKLTPEDIEVLKAIDIELNKSSNLQSYYTREIAKMPNEMLEIDKNSMINVFMNLFNLKEHFNKLTRLDTHMDEFLYSLQPLFMPKVNKGLGIEGSFAPQKIIKTVQNVKPKEVDIKSKNIVDNTTVYTQRMKNNYFKLFSLMIMYLKEEKDSIEDIKDFIDYVRESKESLAIKSIDFLSFFLSLSYLPDQSKLNDVDEENIQTIKLEYDKRIVDKPIQIFQVKELLTYFWFDKLQMKYNAELKISTNSKAIVYLDDNNERSIGNLKIKLIETGGVKFDR
ncbi:hypothetical protein [Tepidibacter aestuarii]|uniref:hypothetical protein n=1 Tax=Tepidibacter aestuarii TaxID=2925782 RepID=UPI0020C0FFB7|nr:hypothetical protein [Tepidibacter aestuarii]CAH2213888.1 conserved protein of unknown function [Tepidibacter aestuarii]